MNYSQARMLARVTWRGRTCIATITEGEVVCVIHEVRKPREHAMTTEMRAKGVVARKYLALTDDGPANEADDRYS